MKVPAVTTLALASVCAGRMPGLLNRAKEASATAASFAFRRLEQTAPPSALYSSKVSGSSSAGVAVTTSPLARA